MSLETNKILDNLKIYCTYHRPEMFDDYNLYESDIVKPYLLTDKNIFPEWMINRNIELSEFQMMLYIYNESINGNDNYKSDYIGFCHYRRHWNYIDFETLKAGNTVFYISCEYEDKTMSKMSNEGWYYDGLDKFVKEKHPELYKQFSYIAFGPYPHISHREMFITNWNVFLNVVSFVKEWLEYEFGKELESFETKFNEYMNDPVKCKQIYKFYDFYDKLTDYELKDRIDSKEFMNKRSLAMMIEEVLSIAFDLFEHKSVSVYYTHNIDAFLLYRGNCDLEKWILKQYSLGVKNIVIFNYTENPIEWMNNNYKSYKFQECIFIDHPFEDFERLYDVCLYANFKLKKYFNYSLEQSYCLLNDGEFLTSDEIIQYKNELWNNKQITNKKIHTIIDEQI